MNVRHLAGQGGKGDSIDSKMPTIGVSNFPRATRLELDIDEEESLQGWKLSKNNVLKSRNRDCSYFVTEKGLVFSIAGSGDVIRQTISLSRKFSLTLPFNSIP
ncbi:hypothetical protein [Chitinophaga alhagiae]|uniref:hypothetical protein n=1 Tax=Chitinophaga alhagiae TaxID=2203219 RepID=UPI00130079CE|nr:hypothetical protein [Chitinophaga alhagiae]